MTFPPIEVTQEDINNGIPGESCGCPIALALKRMGCRNVEVHHEFVEFDYGTDLQVRGSLPDIAKEFIITFDEEPYYDDGSDDGFGSNRARVAPFTFTLPEGP